MGTSGVDPVGSGPGTLGGTLGRGLKAPILGAMPPPPPSDDADVPRFLEELGLPGVIDIHVHTLPAPMQQRVWEHFDRLDPPWPIAYRTSEEERLTTLRQLGVTAHTGLAYAHRPGMAAWLNDHTLSLAEQHDAIVPTFTFYPEEGVEEYVADALGRGGVAVKIHLQVGKFDPLDERLAEVWAEVERRELPVILHAAAVPDDSGGEEFCGPEPVQRLLEAHGDLVLVIAHAGAPRFEEFLDLTEAAPTIHLDTAMVLTDPEYLGGNPDHLIERYADLADRIAFGSDFPSIPHEYAAQIRGLVNHGFDDDWLRTVMWDTPRRLLRLDTA